MTAVRAQLMPRPRAPARPWRRRDTPLARPRRRVAFGLWLPVSAFAVLLVPLALVSIPILELTLKRRGLSPARAVLGLGALLFALSGTVIDVDAPAARIRIRIF